VSLQTPKNGSGDLRLSRFQYLRLEALKAFGLHRALVLMTARYQALARQSERARQAER